MENDEIKKDLADVEELEGKVAPDVWDWLAELTAAPGEGKAAPELRKEEAREMLRNIEVEELEGKVAPDWWDWLEELTAAPGEGKPAAQLRQDEAREVLRNIDPNASK